MSEDNMLRFIILAVVVFLFVITVSVIMIYYNTAIRASETVMNTTVDFGQQYLEELKNYEGKTLRGTEIMSIIRNIPIEKQVRITCLSLGIIDYIIPRGSDDNVREGNMNVIKKADSYHIVNIIEMVDEVEITLN